MQNRYVRSILKLLFSLSLTLVAALLFGVFSTASVQTTIARAEPAAIEVTVPGQTPAGVIAAEAGLALTLVGTLQVTPTDEITDTEEMTDTEEVTDTEEMTATEEIIDTEEMTVTDALSPTGETAVRASELLDYQVVDAQDEAVGEVEDLIIGLDSGRIPYALVDFDEELLGLTDEFLRAVPLSQLGLSSEEGVVTFEADTQMLQNVPAFVQETGRDLIRPDWDIELRETWQMGETMTSTQSEAMTGTETLTGEAFIRASDLMDYDVINPTGEELGEIEDIMVGLDSETVNYVVLAAGGFLGLGQDLFAIPYRAIVVDPQIARVVLNVTEESIENAPGFDPDNWPNSADPQWDVETREFWDQTDVTRVVPGPFITGRTIDEAGLRASEILSYTVTSLEGGNLGRVTDLMIGLNSGQVKYALVATGEITGEAQTVIPIPFYAFAPDMGGLTLATTLDEEMVANAPTFDVDNWPDTSVPEWELELRDYWAGAGVEAVQPAATPGVVTTPIDEPARRASEMLGAEVNLSQQESSATIEDLIIGLNSQYVNYAVVSLDQGLIPVFFPLINFDEQGTATLDVEPQVLEQAPVLEADTWPETLLNPQWDLIYRNYWVASGRGASVIEASDLLDRDIVNLQDEGLGEIEDLVVGLDNGQISYAIVGSGGFLGLGEDLRAVPMSELRLDPFRQVMILNVDEETFENSPSFGQDDWPDLSNPDWETDFRGYWAENLTVTPTMTSTAETDTEDGDQVAPQAGIRASELLDYDTQNMQNEDLGELSDLIISLDEERVKYAVISVGGFLGIGEKLVAVPLEILTIDPAQELISLDADQQTLEEAPGVEDIDLLNITNADWDVEIQSYWGNR